MTIRSETRKWLWRIRGRLGETVTVQTRQGRLTVSLRDQTIGKRLYCRGEYELDWTRRALAFLRARGRLPARGAGCVLDIGAHLGVISIGMLVQGELARGVAVEADALNHELLVRNIAQNDLTGRLVPIGCALTDTPGSVELELCAANFGDHRVKVAGAPGVGNRATTSRPADTLDRLAARGFDADVPQVDLVWMDVQGHEAHVIRGGRTFLGSGMPVVSEVWPEGLRSAGTTFEELSELAHELWSTVWIEKAGTLVEHPVGALRAELEDLDRRAAYANVIFLP